MISIVKADCLDFLHNQPAGSIDLVFGSPPYEDRRTYGMRFRLSGQEWVKWMVQVFSAAQCACKGLVAFVVEGAMERYARAADG